MTLGHRISNALKIADHMCQAHGEIVLRFIAHHYHVQKYTSAVNNSAIGNHSMVLIKKAPFSIADLEQSMMLCNQ